MMGGGVCWLDYNNDGWLDLFAVNNYTDSQYADWESHGGPPTSELFRNDHGKFVNVTARRTRACRRAAKAASRPT